MSAASSVELCERIARWREHKGLSQQQLASKIGVTVAAVYQWEGTGESKTVPRLENLTALVEALGLTMERFYGRLPKARAA
jgi:transcriptional regulator with XRE-family HTH domain